MLNKLLNLIKVVLTGGKDNQAFIGAKWLVILLRVTPYFMKRNMALRILAISPHYFYRQIKPEYKNLPSNQWLEAEYERNHLARERICDQVLFPNLKAGDSVLDVGCGPGFLAKAVARHVKRVYACDISLGVLECARIINNSSNIEYIYSGEHGFSQINDSSLDLAYSFAVIQHVRESVINYLLRKISKKLRHGGRCLFQVELNDDKWRKESEWAGDKSVVGRLKLKYALNYFPRSEVFFREAAFNAGLSLTAVHPMSLFLDQPFDDVYHQHLIVLTKN